jgi:hypothetical protein
MQRMLGLMTAAVLATAGCGGSGEDRADAGASPGATAGYTDSAPGTTGLSGATSGEFAAEIVSVDNTARTVTLKESAVGGTAATTAPEATGAGTTGPTMAGGTTTVRVDGTAGDMLADLKTGDQVVVSCSMGGGAGAGLTDTTAGTTGTTGAGGMGTTGTTGGTTMAAGTLAGCTSVTAIRKAG